MLWEHSPLSEVSRLGQQPTVENLKAFINAPALKLRYNFFYYYGFD